MVKFEKRREHSQLMVFLAPFWALVAMVLTTIVVFWGYDIDPTQGMYVFFIEPLTIKRTLFEIAVKATPMMLIAVGLAMGYRANIWNIGAEGQLIMGALLSGTIAVNCVNINEPWVLPLMLLGGAVGGFLYAMIPAILKYKFRCNEILTSLMLVYIATQALHYLILGPLKNPAAYNFPESVIFNDSAVFDKLIAGTRLHFGFIIAIIIAICAYIFMTRHIIGFQLEIVGLAPRAGNFMGVHPALTIFTTLGVTGALAGLAGAIELAGPLKQITPHISPGYGFSAIIVAFLGRLHPLGIIFASFAMAMTYIGGENAQIVLKTPQAISSIFQSVILFYLLAFDFLVYYKIKIGK